MKSVQIQMVAVVLMALEICSRRHALWFGFLFSLHVLLLAYAGLQYLKARRELKDSFEELKAHMRKFEVSD